MDNIEEKSIEELQEFIVEEIRKAVKVYRGYPLPSSSRFLVENLFNNISSINGVDVELEQDTTDPFKFFIRTYYMGSEEEFILDVSREIEQ
jgi:hypothetical protein